MDIGIFKASRGRLILWMVIPPVVAIGMGLSSYTLQLRSQWKLNRAQKLSSVLPRLASVQQEAHDLLSNFQASSTQHIKSEDEMISFLQDVAQQAGFVVDSLKVERRRSVQNIPMLKANVMGAGSYEAIELFLGDVGSSQNLLSESSLKLSQSVTDRTSGNFQAEIEFELMLFNSVAATGGSAQ
jgi:Tfp pilus assembly protein PilO